MFICVYYTCYTFRNHKTPSLPAERCHPKVKHLEQTRWFGIVQSSQHPKGLCTDAPCHHVQVMEWYPYYILLLNLLSASFPLKFASNACLAYMLTARKKIKPTQRVAEIRIPSPASTRPLNMLPKEANGMREGASKLLPRWDFNNYIYMNMLV